MTLPPERITVKRRRDEDPVEALQLPRSKQRPSAVWHLARTNDGPPLFSKQVASLMPDACRQLPNDTPPTAAVSALGTILVQGASAHPANTLSQLFQTNQNEVQDPPSPRKSSSIHMATRPVRRDQNPHDAQRLEPVPRKFHLTRSTSSSPYSYHISKPSAQQSRKSRRELAVFVERTERALKAEQAHIKEARNSITYANVTVEVQGIPEPERARRRPNATAVERQWRTDNWGRPVEPAATAIKAPKLAQSVTEPSDQWDYESPRLAEQLQQIALQEIQAQEKGPKDLSQPKLRTQPKPPKPRQPGLQQFLEMGRGEDIMTDPADVDDAGLYVFDTYVRSTAGQDGEVHVADPNVDVMQAMSPAKFGIIVIDDDKEELWETYGEDQESDAEWDSEEEDENAEDFYGNDYPEDEVSSEDEFGRGAYNHRNGASDDEEFGERVASWSDEESQARSRWSTS